MIDNWVPLFSQVLDSTLWEEPPDIRVTFLTMLVLKGPDQVVRMPFRRLAKRVNLSERMEENEPRVKEALRVLMNPDTKSLQNQEFEGRRILEVQENGSLVGWLIVNGRHYQEDVMKMLARVRKTQKQRERREGSRGNLMGPLIGEGSAAMAASTGDKRAEDNVTTLALPEDKTHEQTNGRGRTAKPRSGRVKGKDQSGMAEGSGGALPNAPSEGAGEAIGAGDNQPGAGDGGVQAAEGSSESLSGLTPEQYRKEFLRAINAAKQER